MKKRMKIPMDNFTKFLFKTGLITKISEKNNKASVKNNKIMEYETISFDYIEDENERNIMDYE